MVERGLVGYLVNVQEDFGWGKGVVWVLGEIDGSGWWGMGCANRRSGSGGSRVVRDWTHLRLREGLVGKEQTNGMAGRWPYH